MLQYIYRRRSVVAAAAAAAAAANGPPQLYVAALLAPNDNAPSNILLMKRNDIPRHLQISRGPFLDFRFHAQCFLVRLVPPTETFRVLINILDNVH